MKKIIIQGKGNQTLSDQDYLTKGGQGEIYCKGNIIFKLYHDPSAMIPLGKIDELKVLNESNIMKPLDVILNTKKVPIGFTMDKAEDGIFLCKLFSTGFWKGNKITPDTILKLVENIQESIYYIHKNECLIVDLNELNIIVTNGSGFTKPVFIDVDSYQTKSYPANAIMASIRDYQAKTFSENTDWFSLAILSCYMWLGIHPFKGGSHPQFEKNDPNLIEKRMKANISVFNKSVSTPRTMRDINNIPSEYQKWFISLFEKGNRCPPPAVPGMIISTPVEVVLVKSTNNFEITPIKKFSESIVKVKYFLGNQIVITTDGIYLNGKYVHQNDSPSTDVIYSKERLIPIKICVVNGFINLIDLFNGIAIAGISANAEGFMIDNNDNIFIKNGGTILEVKITEIGTNRIIASFGKSWRVMTNSSKLLDNMIFEDIVGKANIIIPRDGNCHRIRVPELDDFKVIDGKHDNGTVVLIGKIGTDYKKVLIRTNGDDKHVRVDDCLDYPSINFVTLGPRIVMINDDNSLELLSVDPGVRQSQRIEDPDINSSMFLTKSESKVLFYQDNRLYQISMRTK